MTVGDDQHVARGDGEHILQSKDGAVFRYFSFYSFRITKWTIFFHRIK